MKEVLYSACRNDLHSVLRFSAVSGSTWHHDYCPWRVISAPGVSAVMLSISSSQCHHHLALASKESSLNLTLSELLIGGEMTTIDLWEFLLHSFPKAITASLWLKPSSRLCPQQQFGRQIFWAPKGKNTVKIQWLFQNIAKCFKSNFFIFMEEDIVIRMLGMQKLGFCFSCNNILGWLNNWNC